MDYPLTPIITHHPSILDTLMVSLIKMVNVLVPLQDFSSCDASI